MKLNLYRILLWFPTSLNLSLIFYSSRLNLTLLSSSTTGIKNSSQRNQHGRYISNISWKYLVSVSTCNISGELAVAIIGCFMKRKRDAEIHIWKYLAQSVFIRYMTLWKLSFKKSLFSSSGKQKTKTYFWNNNYWFFSCNIEKWYLYKKSPYCWVWDGTNERLAGALRL